MKAKTTGCSQVMYSKHGGDYRYLYFKDSTGKVAKTCIYKGCRNYGRWKKIMKDTKNKVDVWVQGLIWKDKESKLIDADSMVVRMPDAEEV